MKKGRKDIGIEYDSNEIINIKNLKTHFRNVCNTYKIINDKLYYIKKTKIKNNIGKLDLILEEILVLTVEEINNMLYEYHTDTCHGNYKKLKKKFNENKIGYIGIDNIIQDYVSNCPVCIQISRSILRENPIKSLNADGPDNIYEFDITYLNANMAESFGIKYILGLLDYFSSKAMIYGLKSKNADEILNHIIEFCLYLIFLKKFIPDNGPEFKNSKINFFCKKNNISFIHGVPYNPHTQGTIERYV